MSYISIAKQFKTLQSLRDDALTLANLHRYMKRDGAAKVARKEAFGWECKISALGDEVEQKTCPECGEYADELYDGICEECIPPMYDCPICQDQGMIEEQVDVDDFVCRPCPDCGWEDDPYDDLLDQRARAYPC